MCVEGDGGSARPGAEEGPQRGSSRWKAGGLSLGVPRQGGHQAAVLDSSSPLSCLPRAELSPPLCSRFQPSGRHPHLLCLPLLFQATPLPVAPAQRPDLFSGPVAWARVCGWQWHSKGAENRPHPQNRQQGEVGLRHLGAWLADHKSWKCLTRSLLQGLEGWTLQGPSVAETSCHLPLEGRADRPTLGRRHFLPYPLLPFTLGLPWPPGREDCTPSS